MEAVITKLMPAADIVTPNIFEAEALTGLDIRNTDDMLAAAEKISRMIAGAVLVKGGHLTDTADDLLYIGGRAVWYHGERIDNPNSHGTGCTLSSAIACGLAKGRTLEQSVSDAKAYVSGALKAGLDLGRGRGPLNHFWNC